MPGLTVSFQGGRVWIHRPPAMSKRHFRKAMRQIDGHHPRPLPIDGDAYRRRRNGRTK